MAEKLLTFNEIVDQMHVLVVEPDQGSVRLLRDIFYTLRIQNMRFVPNGQDALTQLKRNPYQLVLAAWDMKGMTASEFIMQVRRDFDSKKFDVPIIVLASCVTKHDVVIARDAGATEFITKPVSVEVMKNIILSTIKNPRNFIIARSFVGPDRRRKKLPPPDGKEKRSDIPPEDTKIIDAQ